MSRRVKNRTSTTRPSGGGEARRVWNGSESPGASAVRSGSEVQV
jgi:hypothetical protein